MYIIPADSLLAEMLGTKPKPIHASPFLLQLVERWHLRLESPPIDYIPTGNRRGAPLLLLRRFFQIAYSRETRLDMNSGPDSFRLCMIPVIQMSIFPFVNRIGHRFELMLTRESYAVIIPFEAESLRKTLLARCAHVSFDPAFFLQGLAKVYPSF